MARQEDRYQALERSTIGIMFMGTPHDGADAAKLGSTIVNITKSVTTPSINHLELLRRESESLRNISREFGFLENLKIVTVIESNKTRIPHTNIYRMVITHRLLEI